MKRFNWRLQRLLDVKAKTERLRRAELLRLAEQLATARTALIGQKRILRDTMHRLADREPKARVSDQPVVMEHAAVNDAAIRRLEEHISALAAQHEAKAAEVVAMRREKEGLERLREKAYTEYRTQQEKRQQDVDDDRNSMTFTRRQQSCRVTSVSDANAYGDRS